MGEVVQMRVARGRRQGEGEPWSRKAQVAEHFAVSTRTIERWVKLGMPSRPYGVVLFQLSKCEDWLAQQAGRRNN